MRFPRPPLHQGGHGGLCRRPRRSASTATPAGGGGVPLRLRVVAQRKTTTETGSPSDEARREREADVGAKIARLRALQARGASYQAEVGDGGGTAAVGGRIPPSAAPASADSTPSTAGADDANGSGSGSGGGTTAGLSWDGLPDWKKTELLQSQMEKAEAFLGVGGGEEGGIPSSLSPSPLGRGAALRPDALSSDTATSVGVSSGANVGEGSTAADGTATTATTGSGIVAGGGEAASVEVPPSGGYQPKVSTWGVFERPANISKAYGGGRKIPIGGGRAEPLSAEAVAEKEARAAATAARLAAYRASVGIDLGREEAAADTIAAAMASAAASSARSRYAEAVSTLSEVAESYCSPRTAVGGGVWLQLALACEAAGERDRAEGIYRTLRSRCVDAGVKRRAKELLFGFEAEVALKFQATPDDVADVAAAARSRSALGQRRGGVGGPSYRLPDMGGTVNRYDMAYVDTRAPEVVAREEADLRRLTVAVVAALAAVGVGLPLGIIFFGGGGGGG
ncbi:hypothetical protein MMPV_007858 [Pyropia vietnamensis]